MIIVFIASNFLNQNIQFKGKHRTLNNEYVGSKQ